MTILYHLQVFTSFIDLKLILLEVFFFLWFRRRSLVGTFILLLIFVYLLCVGSAYVGRVYLSWFLCSLVVRRLSLRGGFVLF